MPWDSFSLGETVMGGHPGFPQPGNSFHLHEEEIGLEKKNHRVFRENSSPWRAWLKMTISLIVTFELEARGANHAKTRRKNLPGRGNTVYKDCEERKGLTSAQNHHHNKTGMIGVAESRETECDDVGEVSRNQIRNGFRNHGRECNFLLRKMGQHWTLNILSLRVIKSELHFSKACQTAGWRMVWWGQELKQQVQEEARQDGGLG